MASTHATPPDVIAIDGPAGSGKGTAAKAMAERLGWRLLDSGTLYRIVALTALRRGIELDAGDALADMARGLDISFSGAAGAAVVDGRDESAAIRAHEVDAAASEVSALPAVRTALLEAQRGFRQPPGLVADGRDMGTVVFPDARLKIFLTASIDERARRRHRQLREAAARERLKNPRSSVSLRALSKAIEARDQRDIGRAASPLVAAPDAVTIDSSSMSIVAVVQTIWSLVAERGMGRPATQVARATT